MEEDNFIIENTETSILNSGESLPKKDNLYMDRFFSHYGKNSFNFDPDGNPINWISERQK